MIRVLIVDDQALMREGLRTVLEAKGLDVVGEAANGLEAVEHARKLRPDVVLMDLRMPVLDGVAATRRIAELGLNVRVIALTTFDDRETVLEALRAGAIGYLLKDTRSAALVDAIEHAVRGESILEPSVAATVVSELARMPAHRDAAADLGLSEREIAVLRELSRGATNKEISTRLSIAEGTVKNHVTSIFTKLGVTDRTQAALKAQQLGVTAKS